MSTYGAFRLSELTGQPIPIVMRISLLIKTNHPDQSIPKYYTPEKRDGFQKTSWKKSKATFVWPSNEKARTRQKQQTTKIERFDWFVEWIQTHFWLVKRTLGWKNFMPKNLPKNFLAINRYFALTSYCDTIDQSNNAFSILGFSLAGKRRVHVLIFSSIGW